MNESAATIKDRVSAREAARHYGLPFDRQGWACCPFHHETQPSLRLYEGKGGWHCFGCGKGGSVIDLVMQLEAPWSGPSGASRRKPAAKPTQPHRPNMRPHALPGNVPLTGGSA